ncbi:Acyl-CoA synthetase (AMP-forming)/AMP-acid ligase II [Salinihabitans flavidus]|uniref:Acyl-CoA synthetase (AMP-forming)/AMP-acid ligase II n=1 Tax=Salinihabitans flavidus TaxID=569882 RepID=A0A1H8REG7_9RHOB|nr:AMP-binding protein [Salinihabitans flavidus]SEO64756.1 Acyl-CoA synthetase (AMP-forming)/AMP-acid ligase II [Salinihabitans flavidus]
MPLRTRLTDLARQRPDAPAARLGGVTYTRAALAQAAARVDGALRALPVGPAPPRLRLPPGARLMALATGNHPGALPLLAAALSGPHAIAMMDPEWPAPDLGRLLDRLRPDILALTPAQPALWNEAAQRGIPVWDVTAAPWQTHAPGPLTPGEGADSFLVGFTSGTSGTPRAFARNRQSWRESLAAGHAVFGLSEASHTLAPGPLAHGLALYALAETLDIGACFHSMPRFSARKAARALATGAIARLVAVPTMLDALVPLGPFPALGHVTTAGAKLSPELLTACRRAFPNATITEYYGASELGFVTLSRHDATGSSAPADSVGHPFPHVTLELRGEDGPAAPSQPGTVFIRSPQAIAGYLWGDGGGGFHRAGDWASVGDIGRIGPDGSLTLLGREDGMIITGGYNVYPQEVARVLAAAPGVAEAEVLGLPDPHLGQRIAAVLRCETPPDAATLIAHCAAHLPRYKSPRDFYTVAQWPFTASGKIARGTLLRWLQDKDTRLDRIDTAP